MGSTPSIEEIQDQVTRLLLEQEVGALATLRGGRPHVATMHFASDGLAVYCHTFTPTRTYAALLANANVSYTLTAFPPGGFYERNEARWLQVAGRASILEDREEIDHAIRLSGEQFPWLKDSNIYDGFKQASYSEDHVFFRIDAQDALWSDNRVDFQWHQTLHFSPDGRSIVHAE
jgi:nitroimidazol reductase NimA-like FMN-containing flavoprotein (pyridoxamine 5'-phosphate oxidase superfamily)